MTAAERLRPPGQRRAVVFYCTDPQVSPGGHDVASKAEVAEGLAGVLGCPFGGSFDPSHPLPKGTLYVVPSDTLTDLTSAHRLGIHDADGLFGGVVPHPFVAGKTISHPLVAADAAAPAGWSPHFGVQVRSAVLPGFSVFTPADARRAGACLLEGGAVRLKDPNGVGGSGQWVVRDGAELEARLATMAPAALQGRGLVVERNLNEVTTHSVGQVQVGELTAAYCGVQSTTSNHRGEQVYGGSQLVVARGGFEPLLRLDLSPAIRLAVEQALDYHRAALASFTGMFVSRSNYDVAQGVDDLGVHHSGVLEQSWRIGGASGAEVAALQALVADPELQTVKACTCERYGNGASVPPGAWVLFDGIDPHVGRITKYAMVQDHGGTA